MENPIPEAELKPIVEVVMPSMTLPPLHRRCYYEARNLPELEPGAKYRNIGAVGLTGFGLTCDACGHIMPRASEVAAYIDYFSIPGCKRDKRKKHMFCPNCSSEILMEDQKIISGATEYPPGAVTGGFIVHRARTNSVGALAAATNKLTIDGSSGQ